MTKYPNLMAAFVANLATLTASQCAVQRETICESLEEAGSDEDIANLSRQLACVDTCSEFIHGSKKYTDARTELYKMRVREHRDGT